MENNIQIFNDSKGRKMALLIRADYSGMGIEFLTKDEDFMQVAYMGHKSGHVILPHYHNKVKRTVDYTCESLIIRKGSMQVDLYEDMKPLHSFIVRAGDILTLYSGGHGFKAKEDLEMVEIKQGPYIGPEDKTRF